MKLNKPVDSSANSTITYNGIIPDSFELITLEEYEEFTGWQYANSIFNLNYINGNSIIAIDELTIFSEQDLNNFKEFKANVGRDLLNILESDVYTELPYCKFNITYEENEDSYRVCAGLIKNIIISK